MSFAFVKHDEEIDRIPLYEVEYVKSNDEIGAMDIELETTHEHFCLQVATDPQGHNSGRSYYMRTTAKETYDEFFPVLIKFSKAARKRAQASTTIQKIQRRIRKIYGHVICQSIFALIIVGVSSTRTCAYLSACPQKMLIPLNAELHLHHPRVAVRQRAHQPRRLLYRPRHCPRPSEPMFHHHLHSRARDSCLR